MNGSDNMSEKRKTALISILAGIVLFLLVGMTTYAWISAERKAEAKKGEMGIEGNKVLTSEFTAYSYIDEDETVAIVKGEDIILPKYDTVFTERNENSVLIFRVPVFGTTIQAKESYTVTLTLKDLSEITGLEDYNYKNGDKDKDSSDYVGADAVADFISNVIFVKCAVVPEETLQVDEVTEKGTYDTVEEYIYYTVLDYMKNNVETSKTFVTSTTTGDVTTWSKTNSMTFTISNYGSAMVSSGTVYMYIEMGYDDKLVSNMMETRNLSFEFGDDDDNMIEMQSDLYEYDFSSVN